MFFRSVPVHEFIFGTQWSPQTAIRTDQVGCSGAFGAVPLFAGTLLISGIAMIVAVPIGLFSAIYLAEYAHPRFRAAAKPLLEVLAGIPTVVYGFFAALTVGPFLRGWGEALGLDVASESALAAGLVMGIMIIPFVSSLVRRHDHGRAAVIARWLARPRRHAVRDDSPGGAAAPRCRASSAAYCSQSRALSAKP